MKKMKSYKKIWTKWLLTYLLIFSMPLLVCILLAYRSSNALEQESRRANIGVLQQIKLTMDSRLHEIQNVGQSISFNFRMKTLLNTNYVADSSYRYELHLSQNELKSIKAANKLIAEIYVFLDNGDVLTSSSFFGSDDAARLMKALLFPWNIEELLDSLNKDGMFLLLHGAENEALPPTLAYMNSVGTYKERELVLITLSLGQFGMIMDSVPWAQDCVISIWDLEKGMILSNSEVDDDLKKLLVSMAGDDAPVFFDAAGNNQMIMSTASDVSDFYYVSVMPEGLFLKKYIDLRNLMLVSLLLCVFMGIAIVFIMLRWNYRPVGNLIFSVSQNSPQPLRESENEFHTIRDFMDRIFSENKDYSVAMQQQKAQLQYNALTMLLLGPAHETEGMSLEEFAERYDIRFAHNFFIVILFTLIESGEQETISMESQRFIIVNILYELMGDRHHCYAVNGGGLFAIIVNTSEEEAVVADITAAVAQMRRFIVDQFGFDFTAASSGVFIGIHSIARGYREAAYALDHALMHNTGELVSYSELVNADDRYHYDAEMENRLTNSIKIGAEDKTIQVLDEIFTENLERKNLSADMAKCLIFDVTSSLVKSMNAGAPEHQIVEKIQWEKSVTDMKHSIYEAAAQICRSNIKAFENRPLPLIEEIFAYIRINYASKDLNVNTIAYHFGKNPTYLSTLFKEQTSLRLLDVISKTKIGKAKELMKTDKSLKEIADATGFQNSNAMIRCFKKYENLTPGEYKNMLTRKDINS